jgi:hypothetical protein
MSSNGKKKMKKSKRLVALACVLCLTGLAGAMVSTNYDLSWHVIGGGGGPMSSTNYRMASTVGQIIGVSSSEHYQVSGGYWYGISTLPGPAPGVFDTGPGGYPSIPGTHNGTITPDTDLTVNMLSVYSCTGTGGHAAYVRIWNGSVTLAEENWSGYQGDWQNLMFNNSFTLYANETYNYTIVTGSYPQIIHSQEWNATGGVITCTEFVDRNGKRHEGWIPAIRLS